MSTSPVRQVPHEPGRPLEVVTDPTPAEALPPPALPRTLSRSDVPQATVAVPPSPVEGPPPSHVAPNPPPRRQQVAPFVDLYQPTWLSPVIKALILDEHGAMPRTVQAQVGFAALLMGVQFCLDMLAWVLGFRWVFVNAMGWPGWFLAFLFAFLISGIILIFERFVITADVYARRLPLLFNPAILMRVAVVILFASVTAIPVEMLVFHDVIQGRLNGDLQGVRESARQQLRADYRKDLDDLATEEGNARKRVKEETPPVQLEELTTPQLDARIREIQAAIDKTATDLREEEVGWRSGRAGQGRQYMRLKDQKEQLEAQIAEVKKLRQAEIDRRTQGNAGAEAAHADRHFKELSRISDRYEPRKRELEKKLREVDRMGDKELEVATKREFKVVDGFARRWKLMNDLEKEDPIFATTKWGVRILFIAFGLLVLTTKALFNRPTKAYYAGLDPLRVNDGARL